MFISSDDQSQKSLENSLKFKFVIHFPLFLNTIQLIALGFSKVQLYFLILMIIHYDCMSFFLSATVQDIRQPKECLIVYRKITTIKKDYVDYVTRLTFYQVKKKLRVIHC